MANYVDTEPLPPLPALADCNGNPSTRHVAALADLRAAVRAIRDAVLRSYDAADAPGPGADLVGHRILVTRAGEPTQEWICVRNSSGGYEWMVGQQSS